jgi:hypothetical protein
MGIATSLIAEQQCVSKMTAASWPLRLSAEMTNGMKWQWA